MSTTVYVPSDSSARSVGADAVASAIEDQAERVGESLSLVRNGSRGLFWLEPLVEVATEEGRIAYGPVTAADVPGLFDAGFLRGGDHALGHGPTERIPYLANQERLTFARVGVTAPLSLADYRAHGGLRGLEQALSMDPAAIVEEVTGSGLRGRGGAAFPAGVKWKTVYETEAAQKYITCNADEGDSGTFADRMLMEGDPFSLIEGMVIAGLAVGATEGYIYVRAEYPDAYRVVGEALRIAREEGLLGDSILGSDKRFDLWLRLAAGAYICGEETSMLESLEGKRGEIRYKPPLPAVEGLFGKPTVVNNVVTLATVPLILDRGAEHYRNFGVGKSRGTQPIQLAGNIARGGLVEKAFGVTLKELIYDYGGGTATGRPVRALQVGGPLGAYVPHWQLDVAVDYEALAEQEAMLGHGGIVVFDDSVDMAKMARFAMEFCAIESCGKCTPCRMGSVRGVEVLDRITTGRDRDKNLTLLDDLCDTMIHGSLCAMGGLTPYPVQSALRHFPDDFHVEPSRRSLSVK